MRRAALDAAFSATTIDLKAGGTSYQAGERRETVAASYERRTSGRWTYTATLGATVGGSLRTGRDSFDLLPGPLAAGAISYRALDDKKAQPFVLLSLSLAGSVSETVLRGSTSMESIVSTDARLGIAAGKTIARVLTPYVVARAFGGPIFWSYAGHDATGTDAYHYQVGAGFAFALRRFDVHLEMAPLGERELAVGAGLGF